MLPFQRCLHLTPCSVHLPCQPACFPGISSRRAAGVVCCTAWGGSTRARGYTLCVAREDALACSVTCGPPQHMFPCLLAQGMPQAFPRYQKRAELDLLEVKGKRAEEEEGVQQSICRFFRILSPTYMTLCLLS